MLKKKQNKLLFPYVKPGLITNKLFFYFSGIISPNFLGVKTSLKSNWLLNLDLGENF